MPADEQGKRGARDMLEYVYDDESDVPEGLENRTNEAIADSMSKSDAGDFAALNLQAGYHKSHHWDEEARHVTRLGEESQTVYLARWESGELKPWVDQGYYSWDLSSVRVNYKQLKSCAPLADAELTKQLAQLKAEEKRFDEENFVLPLIQTDGVWLGAGLDEKNKTVKTEYNEKIGLKLTFL
ncbi:MAG: hypothetical protein R3F02_19295 [Thiolinea sp.]